MIVTRLPTSLRFAVAPAVRAVTTADAKAHLRVTFDDDDGYIDSLIDAAADWCQEYTRRQFIQATFDLRMDLFPSGRSIVPPRGPLISVSSITYFNTQNVLTTLPADNYEVIPGERDQGEITLLPGKSWPATSDRYRALTVRHVAGYGAAPGDIPTCARQAILLHVGTHYETRESPRTSDTPDLTAIKSLLDTIRMIEV